MKSKKYIYLLAFLLLLSVASWSIIEMGATPNQGEALKPDELGEEQTQSDPDLGISLNAESRVVLAHVNVAASTDSSPTKEASDTRRLELIQSFPEAGSLAIFRSIGEQKKPLRASQGAERLEDGRLEQYYGERNFSGEKDGYWVRWRDGRPLSVEHWKNGMPVAPKVLFHPNGQVRSYFGTVDDEGRVQGKAWHWKSDGSSHAISTYTDNRSVGESIELDGIVSGG